MELEEILSRFIKGIKPIDDVIEHGRRATTRSNWGTYLPGVGSGYESDFRDELVDWWNDEYSDSFLRPEQKYPEKSRAGSTVRCDICLFETNQSNLRNSEVYDWAIELKFVRNIGDNGGVNNFSLGKVVSPFLAERSSAHDCRDKLADSAISRRKAVIIYGFEFDGGSVQNCKDWLEAHPELILEHQKGRANNLENTLHTNTDEGEWAWNSIIPIFEVTCKTMGVNLGTCIIDEFDGLTRHPMYRKVKFMAWEVL